MTRPAAPPPIQLQDLDRDELLQLLAGRVMMFTLGDLWRVRWDTLSARAAKARDEASKALNAYLDCGSSRISDRRVTQRHLIRELQAEEAAKAAWTRAKARAERAEAAEERAWRALEACDRGRMIA